MEATHKLSKVAMTKNDRLVVFASALGTVFEWYDFLLVGALAAEISKHFFSGVNPAAAFIFTLLEFCRRLCRSASRCSRFRTHRRSGRTQVHLPRSPSC